MKLTPQEIEWLSAHAPTLRYLSGCHSFYMTRPQYSASADEHEAHATREKDLMAYADAIDPPRNF